MTVKILNHKYEYNESFICFTQENTFQYLQKSFLFMLQNARIINILLKSHSSLLIPVNIPQKPLWYKKNNIHIGTKYVHKIIETFCND